MSRNIFLVVSLLLHLPLAIAFIGSAQATTVPANKCAAKPREGSTQKDFECWSGDIKHDDVWTYEANDPSEVVDLVNWAHANGWRVRPSGYNHGWSPLLMPVDFDCSRQVLLVDMRRLNKIDIFDADGLVPGKPVVRAQGGSTLESILKAANKKGYGILHFPAVGRISLGGALAIGAHGAALPAKGEVKPEGQSFGCLSNLVLQLTVVAWDESAGRYSLKTLKRSDEEIGPLLTALGRTIVTEAVLQLGPRTRVRCQSYVDIPNSELYASPSEAKDATGKWRKRAFGSFVESTGRVEAILYPFTGAAWLKVWSVAPKRPLFSRQVSGPYNYPFSDRIPEEASDLISKIVKNATWLTPEFGILMQTVTATGLALNAAYDIWGWNFETQLYIQATTLREHANSIVVLTSRDNLQTVVSEVYRYYNGELDRLRKTDQYPINGPLEMRASGVDKAEDVNATTLPSLAATRPVPGHPEWDIAVWINMLTIMEAKTNGFMRQFELWAFDKFNRDDFGRVRIEWSKGWAYTNNAAWDDDQMLRKRIPGSFGETEWNTAVAALRALDPHEVMTNSFLHDELLLETVVSAAGVSHVQ